MQSEEVKMMGRVCASSGLRSVGVTGTLIPVSKSNLFTIAGKHVEHQCAAIVIDLLIDAQTLYSELPRPLNALTAFSEPT
jgi:hypothetical protein